MLTILAACLLGIAVFALIHRRDAFGALGAVVIGFTAVVVALVGFSGSAPGLAAAGQLQVFAILVAVLGLIWVAAGAAVATVLWRRTGTDLLTEPVALLPPQLGGLHRETQDPAATPSTGGDPEGEAAPSDAQEGD